MTNTYTITSSKINGTIELQYADGFLIAIKMALKEPLNDKQFTALFSSLPYREDWLPAMRRLNLTIEQEPEADASNRMPANKKIALFCDFYKKYKNGAKYKASRTDGNKIREFKVNDDILTAYFTSQNFLFKDKHSISNLVRYYNELLAEIAASGKTKHPDYYNKEYFAKLKPDEIPDYWRHLRSLGLQPKKDRMGNTVDWVKAC